MRLTKILLAVGAVAAMSSTGVSARSTRDALDSLRSTVHDATEDSLAVFDAPAQQQQQQQTEQPKQEARTVTPKTLVTPVMDLGEAAGAAQGGDGEVAPETSTTFTAQDGHHVSPTIDGGDAPADDAEAAAAVASSDAAADDGEVEELHEKEPSDLQSLLGKYEESLKEDSSALNGGATEKVEADTKEESSAEAASEETDAEAEAEVEKARQVAEEILAKAAAKEAAASSAAAEESGSEEAQAEASTEAESSSTEAEASSEESSSDESVPLPTQAELVQRINALEHEVVLLKDGHASSATSEESSAAQSDDDDDELPSKQDEAQPAAGESPEAQAIIEKATAKAEAVTTKALEIIEEDAGVPVEQAKKNAAKAVAQAELAVAEESEPQQTASESGASEEAAAEESSEEAAAEESSEEASEEAAEESSEELSDEDKLVARVADMVTERIMPKLEEAAQAHHHKTAENPEQITETGVDEDARFAEVAMRRAEMEARKSVSVNAKSALRAALGVEPTAPGARTLTNTDIDKLLGNGVTQAQLKRTIAAAKEATDFGGNAIEGDW